MCVKKLVAALQQHAYWVNVAHLLLRNTIFKVHLILTTLYTVGRSTALHHVPEDHHTFAALL